MPRGPKLRVYPPGVVERVVAAYEGGATIRQIQETLPRGTKAQTIVERFIPIELRHERRIGNQQLESNRNWKGSTATYAALHKRVEAARGKPSRCARCPETQGRFEWANLTGRYDDIDDYERLCKACHIRLDTERRAVTGCSTMGLYAPSKPDGNGRSDGENA